METKKCPLCGTVQHLTKVVKKVPKKYQVRFGKTQYWYTSDHSCPMLKESQKYLNVLNQL